MRRLSAYVDGELDHERRAMVERHLARCRRCAAALERLEGQAAMLADADPVPPLPAELWLRVQRELEEREQRSWYREHRGGLRRAACVAACVLVGFAAGAFLSWRTPITASSPPRPALSERRLVAEAFDTTIVGPMDNEGGLLKCDPR
jgi:anti-sigma factor RsiW